MVFSVGFTKENGDVMGFSWDFTNKNGDLMI